MAKHGTWSCYVRDKCRCDKCATFYGEYLRDQQQRAKAQPFDQITHGVTGYNHNGCRCNVCRTKHAEYRADLRARRKATT